MWLQVKWEKRMNWQPYFSLRRKVIALLISIVPFIFALNTMFKAILSPLVASIVMVLSFLLYVFIFVGRYTKQLINFPCPNCKNPLHRKGMGAYLFSPRCLHCGISIGDKNPRARK